MDFIATYWYVWAIVLVISIVYATINQVGRFKRVSASIESGSADGAFGNVTKGMGSLVIAGLISWASGILLLIAIVIHAIRYFA
ncbi:MAG TPA: hypothetical protein VEB18_04275 [Candidatus Paceibacterota bacterium]|nr:hypothetical protein [Candidatus Paceibacterota bacterium]